MDRSVVAPRKPPIRGAIHSFVPAMGGASPPSSPSNEPRSRRRASSRKARPKPRSRKQGKPQLASADISTQDSATQGPGSSDTSDGTAPEDGGTPLRSGDVPVGSDEEEEEDECDYGEEGRSLTPNIKTAPVGVTSQTHSSHTAENGIAPAVDVADIKLLQPPIGHGTNFVKAVPTVQSKTELLYANDVSVEVSDGNYSRGYFSVNSPVAHRDTRQWAVKRQESDLSTAPFSSETSDMDTSGNERVTTADSMVDVSSDVHSAQSPPLGRAQSSRKGVSLNKGIPLGKAHGEEKVVGLALGKRLSGSSGDKVSLMGHRNSKKLVSGKNVPSKPPPPASAAAKRPLMKTKSAAPSQSSQSASDSPIVPPRKPLPYQRSTPLLPKKVTRPSPPPGYSQNNSSKAKGIAESQSTPSLASNGRASTAAGSRSAAAKPSVKPAISARPKPPVNPKPSLAKPAVAPMKPAAKAGLSRGVGGVSGGSAKSESVKPPAKPLASHRLSKIVSDSEEDKESSKKENGPHSATTAAVNRARVMRRTPSVENIGSTSRATSQPISKVKSKPKDGPEKEDKKGKGMQLPSLPPVPPHKPSVPSKPRRAPERRISKPHIPDLSETGALSSEEKGANSPSATSSIPATAGDGATPGLVASGLQSGSTKSLSSSDGSASGHSQSPVGSPAASAKKSFHVRKSERAIPSSSSSMVTHKALQSSSTAHKTAPGSASLHKTGASSISSHKTGPGSVTSRRSAAGLHKMASTGSNSSLLGFRDSKKKEKSENHDKTKEVKPKGRDAVERPRIAAIMERRNDRRTNVERKKGTGLMGKTREAGEASTALQVASDSHAVIGGGGGNANSSADVDSATHSVSEVSLTESPSPSPSPFPSASDLSADQSKQRDKSTRDNMSRDSSSSLEESTPPPIPPREYLKSPDDLLALNLQSTIKPTVEPSIEPPTTAGSKPVSTLVSRPVSIISQRRPKQGPRRPPPSPPKVDLSTDAAPTCNIPTNVAERPGDAFADHPATKLVDLRATRDKNRQNVSSHYEVVDEFVSQRAGNGKYFEKHNQRDSVEPVNYSLVKRMPSQDIAKNGDETQVKGPSQTSQSPPPPLPPMHRPVKRATTVGGNSGGIHIRMEKECEEKVEGGRINFMDRKTSISRRPPPRPPIAYPSSSSSSSNSIAPSAADHEDSGDIYSVIDEEDKAALLKRAFGQAAVPSKQPLTQRMSLIIGTGSEDEPPPLPTRPAPKLKSPISPDPMPRNLANKQPHPSSPSPHRGLILARDGPPVMIQPPKRRDRDPVYDVIPEDVKVVRVSRRREYEEIILPELDGEQPKLWIPPEREQQKIQEQEELKKQQEKQQQQQKQYEQQQQKQYEQQQQQQKKHEQQPEQQGDDWSSSSGKSSPFLSKRNSTSSSGSAGTGGANAPLISVILPDKAGSRLAANMKKKSLDIGDLRENWRDDSSPAAVSSPPVIRRKHAMSFSGRQNLKVMARTASCRRSHSQRRSKIKVTTLDPSSAEIAVRRSCSLDHLDDRMDMTVRNSVHLKKDGSSSEEEEEGVGPAVPANTSPGAFTDGLPQLPSTDSPYRVPRSHNKPAGPYLMAPDVEPLYQYINTAEFLRETEEGGAKASVSVYEEQSQLSLARQLSLRRLWCEQPDVISSGILKALTDQERKLQEAMFEVISSESTYLRSLDVLIQNFMDDPGMNPYLPEGRRVIDKRQHHVIFSNVKEVREVSAEFLVKLQSRQKESSVVKNISDIMLEFTENKFDCYIRYCTNQVYQIREMQDIIEGNLMFREYLRRLESDKVCQNLSMQSFLLLPMQRITRLPLLILAILNRTPLDHPDHHVVETTLRSIQMLVTACNDGARQMDRTEQLHEIHKKLEFGKLKPFPIVSASRQLERRGLMVRLQVEQKLLGKNKIKKKPHYVFVFTDYIIITKKKKDARGEEYFRVKDYASRAVVEVEWLNAYTGVSFPKVGGEQDPIAKATAAVSAATAKHGILLLFLDNAVGRKEDYILLAQNDTDRTRWIESMMRQDDRNNDQERIYEQWDCPQVQAVYDYQAKQPDELDLQRGDVVKVYRKMADGWYEGERLRDLQCGWFPSNFTEEIQNAHTKARNLRQTHKLNSGTANARLAVGLKS